MKSIKNKTDHIKDTLELITINTEVIENLNKLISDKLNDIEKINELGLNPTELINGCYEVRRYNECYITLNNLISDEIQKLNKYVIDIFKSINEIENIVKNDKSNTQTNKGV